MKLKDRTKGLLLISPAAILFIYIILILPLYIWITSTALNDILYTIINIVFGLVFVVITCYGILLLLIPDNRKKNVVK